MITRPEKILYRAEVSATGGRDGRVIAVDGDFDVALSVPKELGGPGGDGTNPEQLFAAGYAACFLSAVKLVARSRKLAVANEASVTALVGMGPVAVGYALEVALKVSLPNVDHTTAQGIVEAAHERCPYSKATRDNIAVTVTLV
jgi:osmotically inducible protein OsmC